LPRWRSSDLCRDFETVVERLPNPLRLLRPVALM
jgi:hypothetical protein